MAFIEWSDSLSVNVTEIDNQHKQLIKLINNLYDAMNAGKGKEVLGKTLMDLIDYTKLHFATEEKYMNLYKYPILISHKYEHDMLTKQVISLNDEFQSGKTFISVQVMNFLSNWLKTHIKQNDMKFGVFLNSIGKK